MEYKEEERRPQRFSIDHPQVCVEKDLALLNKPTKGKRGDERDSKRCQKYCLYCQHDPRKEPEKHQTSYHCKGCLGSNGEVYPLCQPTTGRKLLSDAHCSWFAAKTTFRIPVLDIDNY